jgi:predicted nucleotidyltransferase
MRFHGITSTLLGSPARAAVLTTMLRSAGQELTGREVARRASVSPPRAIEALRVLEGERLCFQRRVGRASLWSLEERHFLAQRLQPLADLESAPRRALVELLSRHLGEAQEAYLFGSVAQGRDEPGSDIDLLVVFPHDRAMRRWRQSVDSLQDAVLERFGNHLQPITYTRGVVRRGAPRRLLSVARTTGIRLEAGR